MQAKRAGKIINSLATSSLARPTTVPYQTSKAGIAMLTRGLRSSLAPHDIQVNAIAPGFFRTEMNTALEPRTGVQRTGSRTARLPGAGPSRTSSAGAAGRSVRLPSDRASNAACARSRRRRGFIAGRSARAQRRQSWPCAAGRATLEARSSRRRRRSAVKQTSPATC